MLSPSGRLIIQSDWQDAYREANGKFWVSFKRYGSASCHSYIASRKLANGETVLEAEDSQFVVEHHSPRHLGISFVQEQSRHTTVFKAPSRLLTVHGKNKKVTCLDVAAGGLGLSAHENSTVISVWESGTGVVRRELSGHVGDVYTAKFFPSGIVVLSGGSDMQLKIWSAETGDCAATLVGHKAGVQDCCFVDRGRNVVSCSRDGTAKLWDVSQQACIHTYQNDGGLGVVNSCDIHPVDSAVDLGTPTASSHEREVLTEGKLLLLASESKKVTAFGLQTKQQVFEVGTDSAVNSVRFLTDTHFALGADDGTVCVYDLRSCGEPMKTFSGGGSGVQCIEPYKQGFFFSTGDGFVTRVDETFSPCLELSGADCDVVYRVVHCGTDVYTSCRDGLIRVYTL